MYLLSPLGIQSICFLVVFIKYAALSLSLFIWEVFTMATEQFFLFLWLSDVDCASRFSHIRCFLSIVFICGVLCWRLDTFVTKLSVTRLDDLDLILSIGRTYLCHHV